MAEQPALTGNLSDNIRAIYPRDSADFWFGELGGLSHFQNGVWTNYTSLNSPLPYDDVRDIREDSLGNLWIGTYSGGGPTGGIVKYDGFNWTIYDTSNSSLLANSVGTIAIDPCGTIWCGNYYMNKFDGTTWTLYDTLNSPVPHYNVGVIFADCQGDIWVGTHGGGVVRFHNDCTTMPDCNVVQAACVGIPLTAESEEYSSGLTLYPNPVASKLTLNLKESESDCRIEIFSVTGETQMIFFADSSVPEIDVSFLPAGYYFLLINIDGHINHIPFVKL